METNNDLNEPVLTGQNSSARTWDAEFTNEKGRGRVALAAFGLGFLAGIAALMLAILPAAAPFWVYLFLLVCFHMLEYLLTAAFRPDVLSFENFLLNHSTPYQVMVVVCWLEYWVESALVPPSAPFVNKQWGIVSSCGVCISVLGLAARSVAMATASSNFSHMIEHERRREHELVTSGIYAVLRHPAYFGFFWFSVGTQAPKSLHELLLVNPVCFVAYSIASFRFFYERIPYEEQILVRFFGADYIAYRKRTYIGIPFLEYLIRRSSP